MAEHVSLWIVWKACPPQVDFARWWLCGLSLAVLCWQSATNPSSTVQHGIELSQRFRLDRCAACRLYGFSWGRWCRRLRSVFWASKQQDCVACKCLSQDAQDGLVSRNVGVHRSYCSGARARHQRPWEVAAKRFYHHIHFCRSAVRARFFERNRKLHVPSWVTSWCSIEAQCLRGWRLSSSTFPAAYRQQSSLCRQIMGGFEAQHWMGAV